MAPSRCQRPDSTSSDLNSHPNTGVWGSGWERLSALSRRKPGFESPWRYSRKPCISRGAQRAAVRLMIQNLNATALPRSFDRRVLRSRIRQFMAHDRLDARVETVYKDIAKLGSRSYTQPWTASMTIGRWEACDMKGSHAAVVFIAYATRIPYGTSALTRYTVTMHRERGAWKLVAYDVGWLDSAGPMGDSGDVAIRDLPLRVVFRDPPPRTWRYRGPQITKVVAH
jgi:hypothetical protein